MQQGLTCPFQGALSNPTQISIFLALESVGFAIGNGILVHFFTKRFALKSNFIAFALIGAVCVILMLFSRSALMSWVLIIPLAICVALAYSVLLTLFSDQVNASSQGWVMGITGSIMAFVWGVNGLVGGLLAVWTIQAPYVLVALCFFISAWSARKAKEKNPALGRVGHLL